MDEATNEELPPAIDRRFITPILALAGTTFSALMSLMIPLLAVLPRQLGASSEAVSWLVTSTMLVGALSTLVFGRLGDMLGKRRVLFGVLVGMGMGTLLCAVTDELSLLIVGRALQGVGAATIPLAMAVFRDLLPADDLASAVGLMSSTVGIGAVLGLPLAAVFAQLFDWHVLFGLLTVLIAAEAVLVLRLVPETGVQTGGSFDGVGAALMALVLTATLIVLTQGAAWGWASPPVLGLLAAVAILSPVFVLIQGRVTDPILDLRFFTRRPVLLANLAALCVGFAFFSNGVISAQELVEPKPAGLGLSLAAGGVAQMATGLAMIFVPPVSARVINRWSAKHAVILGAVIMLAGYSLHLAPAVGVGKTVTAMLVVAAGTGFCYSALPMLVMGSVGQAETAAANGVNVLVRMVGQTVSSAVSAAVVGATAVVTTEHLAPTAEGYRTAYLVALFGSVAAVIVATTLPRGVGRP